MGDIWLRTLVKLGLSEEDAQDKLTIFREKLKQHFGKQKQDGGGDTLLNKTGSNFVDAVSTQEGAAAFLSTLPRFVFILDTIEKSPDFGILIAVMMDAMLAGLSTGGELFQNLMILIPGLGPAIVAVFGIFFWPPLAMIAFSREDFSEASEMYLKAIPFGIGRTLSTAFMKTDKFATKFGDRFEEIKERSQLAFGRLKDTLNETASDIEANNPILIKSLRDKADVMSTKALNAAEGLSETTQQKIAESELGSAYRQDRELARNAVPTPTKAPYVPGSFLPKKKTQGGRRKQLSTKKRSKKNKTWRKTKRTKSARR